MKIYKNPGAIGCAKLLAGILFCEIRAIVTCLLPPCRFLRSDTASGDGNIIICPGLRAAKGENRGAVKSQARRDRFR